MPSTSGLPSVRTAHAQPVTGMIQVIFGPMFSGKTTELIRRCKRYKIAKYSCIVIKYANDTRYSAVDICTHDHQSLDAISAVRLFDVFDLVKSSDIIGIDEAQFFPDIVPFCEKLATSFNRTVIVAALDGDFKREPFGDILRLVPLAEQVCKLSAVCLGCSGEAAFTKRISSDQQVEVIGGADKYMASCRLCHSRDVCTPLKERERELYMRGLTAPSPNSGGSKELSNTAAEAVKCNLFKDDGRDKEKDDSGLEEMAS